ncbi:MAG TPA: transcriptional repressor LexA [Pirellulaceae bacterium]|nr:transcriptional repressor LexA [Pirellulaceae bacterium]
MKSEASITPRQREVLHTIQRLTRQLGYNPSIREIGQELGIGSPNGVVGHLRALERARLITRDPFRSRTICSASAPRKSSSGGAPRGLPLAGRIAAGGLTEAVGQRDHLDWNDLFRGQGHYLLEVRGDSMVDADIHDGDYVVVNPQSTARPGSIAVVETDDNEATLKYWFPEKKRIRLQPANRKMKPIYVTDANVRGVVVGVIRRIRER